MTKRVPRISNVSAKTTEEGRVLLKFQDGAFEDPFLEGDQMGYLWKDGLFGNVDPS